MRVRGLPAGVVLCAMLAPATAQAQRESRIVLSGSGIRSVRVTLAVRTQLSFDNFLGSHDAVTASYQGGYAGLAVLAGVAEPRLVGGAVLVRGRTARIGGGYQDPVKLGPEASSPARLDLAPGTYTFVLLADGPATVRVRASRGLRRDLRLTAKTVERRLVAKRSSLSELVPSPAGRIGTTLVPFTLTRRATAVVSFFSSPGDAAPAHLSLCVRPAAEADVPCVDRWHQVVPPGTAVTTSVTERHESPDVRAGRYVFEYSEAIAGAGVRDGNAFIVTFSAA